LPVQKLDIAALVGLGVLKQAPTRCGAGPAHAPQRVGACFSTPRHQR